MTENQGQSFSFIGIGNELLQGHTRDQNGPWLAQFLTQRGHRLEHLQHCGDEHSKVLAALANAHHYAPIAILSGGLGPTRDDLTKPSLAQYCAVKLQTNPRAQQMAQEHYARMGPRGQAALPSNHYTLVPQGFEPLSNPLGLAPGLWGEKHGQRIVALPGVVREFQAMFEQEVYPRLVAKHWHSQRERLVFRAGQIAEEQLWQDNPQLWQQLSQWGVVSSLPRPWGVDIGLDLMGTKKERASKKAALLDLIAQSSIKGQIWQVGDLDLANYVVEKLRQQSASVGFCESCTGGLAAHSLTNVAGSSQVFKGSVVCYANQVKEQVLGVAAKSLQTYGAVSEQVAREMAVGGRRVLGVDYCVSYTGIAGPTGGSPDQAVGTVSIGLASARGERSWLQHFSGDRWQLKEKFSSAGFLHLLQAISGDQH